MASEDAARWDTRWRSAEAIDAPAPPSSFAGHLTHFPTSGPALDIACGDGSASVWLAQHGMQVQGVDVSGIAVGRAIALAERHGMADRAVFAVHDLDAGLPAGGPVELLLCHLFRDPSLDEAMIDRLAPGGLLAIAVLSEVGAEPGPFRAEPGELGRRFAALDPIVSAEADGRAWLLARR